jgi:nitronate monooxygenase
VSVLGCELPLMQAPLGRGAAARLAAAVSRAGGLGSLGASWTEPPVLREQIRSIARVTDRPFCVNLVLDFAQDERLELVVEERVPWVSFSFGLRPDLVRLARAGGARVLVQVASADAARAAADAGADALIVQGVEAGGHRGGFDDGTPGEIGLLALLQLVPAVVDLPLVATGGIATGRGVAAVLAAGASAAQLGTAFMLCPEAATAPAHRDAISAPGETALTRAFTGRAARGIVNRWMREHGAGAPSAYPDLHHVTAKVRAAAREQGDPDGFHLWAGQAHELAEPVPAGELVRRLAAEAQATLRAAQR